MCRKLSGNGPARKLCCTPCVTQNNLVVFWVSGRAESAPFGTKGIDNEAYVCNCTDKMLQHGRAILLLIACVTFLLSFSSVKYLSRIIAAQHSASLSKRSEEGWIRFLDRAEANIGSHLHQFLHSEGQCRLSKMFDAWARLLGLASYL